MSRYAIVLVLFMVGGCSQAPQPTSPGPASAAVSPPHSSDGQSSNGQSSNQSILVDAAAERPDVKWDETSLVKADFDGDGIPDQAALGYVDKGLVLVVGKGSRSGAYKRQFLPFGIGGGAQAAVCGPDIQLYRETLSCAFQTEDVKLPGCIESPAASGLKIEGGDCDPINLYWNHDSNDMAWWRN